MMGNLVGSSNHNGTWLTEVKQRIRLAQQRHAARQPEAGLAALVIQSVALCSQVVLTMHCIVSSVPRKSVV